MGTDAPGPQESRPVLNPPEPINDAHDLGSFDCGKAPLNDWLKERARTAEGRSARTYVVCDRGTVAAGYYCLATGGIGRSMIPGKMRHNMPDPVPVMVLGRLAVCSRYQKMGIGPGLLKDALQRCLQVSQIIGASAVVVHAIDDDAAAFYLKYGFMAFPMGTRTLFLPIATIAKALSGRDSGPRGVSR